mmetsp:Transcript_85095/g.275521  ORF Transcript_85095/g.275521 Transcript_85095/m.275521 type:complete len:216 (-) Transcript_85095:240-887(-)
MAGLNGLCVELCHNLKQNLLALLGVFLMALACWAPICLRLLRLNRVCCGLIFKAFLLLLLLLLLFLLPFALKWSHCPLRKQDFFQTLHWCLRWLTERAVRLAPISLLAQLIRVGTTASGAGSVRERRLVLSPCAELVPNMPFVALSHGLAHGRRRKALQHPRNARFLPLPHHLWAVRRANRRHVRMRLHHATGDEGAGGGPSGSMRLTTGGHGVC